MSSKKIISSIFSPFLIKGILHLIVPSVSLELPPYIQGSMERLQFNFTFNMTLKEQITFTEGLLEDQVLC